MSWRMEGESLIRSINSSNSISFDDASYKSSFEEMDGPDGHRISWDHQGRNLRAVFCHILPPHSNGLTPKGIYAESGAMTWSPLGWVQEHLVWWPLWDLPPRPQHEKVQCNSNISAVDFLASLAHLAWSGILRMRETRRAQKTSKTTTTKLSIPSLLLTDQFWETVSTIWSQKKTRTAA